MRLRRRLGLVAAAYVAVMALGAVSAASASRVRATKSANERAYTVALDQVGRLRGDYLDLDYELRGFVLSGDVSFLRSFEAKKRSVAESNDALAALVQRDPVVRRDLSEIAAAGNLWLAKSAEPAIASRQASPSSLPLADQVIGSGQTFRTLRDHFDRLDRDLQLRRDEAQSGRQRAAHLLTLLVLLTPLLAIAVTFVASRLVDRWILFPIDAMGSALERIRLGDFDATVPSLGPPDVAQLGRRVDNMRKTIASQRDDAVRARESVEQNALLAVRVRNELAADIGQLPAGWTGAASMLPAEGIVAGDCYDVTLLSPSLLAVVVIDIAGHGGGAAVAALRSKEILRAALRARMTPGEAVSHLAGQVGDLDGSFLTAFVATIETSTGECRFASAGHPPALFHNDDALEELMPTGPLIGPFPGAWATNSRVIGRGGKLAVYTDGLTETRDHTKAFYGMERLTAQVLSVPCEDAQFVIDVCFADLKAFSPARFVDDVTIVMICRDCPDPDGEPL